MNFWLWFDRALDVVLIAMAAFLAVGILLMLLEGIGVI